MKEFVVCNRYYIYPIINCQGEGREFESRLPLQNLPRQISKESENMKFVLFNNGTPGLLRTDGVVDLSKIIQPITSETGQKAMEAIISNSKNLKSELEHIEKSGNALSISNVSLLAPLPQPSKIFCMGGNYTEFGHREPGPMWGFQKSNNTVIGPGGTVNLPPEDANIFHHEAELVLVFGRAGKNINEEEAFDYVFGYTCGVDVSARMSGGSFKFQPWRGISEHKSYPTFAPMGPALVTKDEITDPQNVQIRLTVDGQLRGNFNTSDMAHSIAKSIAFVSQFENINIGDVLYTGTNHQGLGAMQDGDNINIEIDQLGGFSFNVKDSLKRRWEKGIDEETAEDIREGTGGPGRRKRPIS